MRRHHGEVLEHHGESYSALKDRMLKRPAVQRVVADEGVKV